jgi:hypothetical protein
VRDNNLIEKLLETLDGGAVDLQELLGLALGVFETTTHRFCHGGFTAALGSNEHESREDAARLVVLDEKGELFLGYVLTDNIFEVVLLFHVVDYELILVVGQ